MWGEEMTPKELKALEKAVLMAVLNNDNYRDREMSIRSIFDMAITMQCKGGTELDTRTKMCFGKSL